MPKINHGRMKPKYNATPTKREREYHLWLIDNVPCVHSSKKAECVHHPLTRHPEQRWRRDHEFVVPMTNEAHMALHAAGSEEKFDPDQDYAELASACRQWGYERGGL